MSLTNFVRTPKVRARFLREFPVIPPLPKAMPLLKAPPCSANYALVGTAFDYLLRFHTKRLNPHAYASEWVAEGAIADPLTFAGKRDWIMSGKDIVPDKRGMQDYRRARRVVKDAKRHFGAFLRKGRWTKELLRSTLLLAQLDWAVR